MPEPFFVFLEKQHTLKKLTSHTETPAAIELQALFYAGSEGSKIKNAYRKKEAEYKLQGIIFRVTKGVVYEMRDEGQTVHIRVGLQVKGHSLTWYFWAPDAMDQYPQEFRDKLYNAAALAHKKVERGCDLYYRGSNAVHIKLMHHHESESNHNHNHYRLVDNKHYTPVDFNQHMSALTESEVHDLFFCVGEIDRLCQRYQEFYTKWTAKIGNKPSREEQYFSALSQRLEIGDVLELQAFGEQQEPCRISSSELKVDYERAREAIERAIKAIDSDQPDKEVVLAKLESEIITVKREYEELLAYRTVGGSRGLHSAIASSRQIKGSANPVVSASVGMDDSIGKEVPDVPKWAVALRAEVDRAKALMIKEAMERLTIGADVDVTEPFLGSPAEKPKVTVVVSTKAIIEKSTPPELGVGLAAGSEGSQVTGVSKLSLARGGFVSELQRKNEQTQVLADSDEVSKQYSLVL